MMWCVLWTNSHLMRPNATAPFKDRPHNSENLLRSSPEPRYGNPQSLGPPTAHHGQLEVGNVTTERSDGVMVRCLRQPNLGSLALPGSRT